MLGIAAVWIYRYPSALRCGCHYCNSRRSGRLGARGVPGESQQPLGLFPVRLLVITRRRRVPTRLFRYPQTQNPGPASPKNSRPSQAEFETPSLTRNLLRRTQKIRCQHVEPSDSARLESSRSLPVPTRSLCPPTSSSARVAKSSSIRFFPSSHSRTVGSFAPTVIARISSNAGLRSPQCL
jgi:hypothetical protein